MKADQKTQTEVIHTLKEMFEAYKKRDLKAVLAVWAPDPDVLVIGSGEDEWSLGMEQFAESVKRDWAQSEAASISHKVVAVSSSGSVAWFAAAVVFEFTIKDKGFDLPGRLTGVMEKRNGEWSLLQMHFSTPAREQDHGESWPKN